MGFAKQRRLIIGFYLVHLLFPLFFLIDAILAWADQPSAGIFTKWGHLGPTVQLVLLVCGSWFIVGLGALFFVRRLNPPALSKLQGPLVSIFAVFATLLVAELFLQLSVNSDNRPGLWPTGHQVLLAPDPRIMPGITGSSTFTVSEDGIRGGPLPSNGDAYEIITIGGSTTEGLYLDDAETWPHLLMEAMNGQQDETFVWVGNAGQAGRNSVDHLAVMQVLPVIDQADMVIFLVGANDLGATLAFQGGPTQEALDQNAMRLRDLMLHGGRTSRPALPLFKHFELFELGKSSAVAVLSRFGSNPVLRGLGIQSAGYLFEKRRERAEGAEVPLPNLDTALDDYKRRIQTLALECQDREIRCVFATQPSMAREGLSPADQALFWSGGVGLKAAPIGYISILNLAVAMDAYNQTLLDVCRQHALECFDLASLVPKDTSAFYDEMHFNEPGSRLVAELLAGYLVSTPPFLYEGQ